MSKKKEDARSTENAHHFCRGMNSIVAREECLINGSGTHFNIIHCLVKKCDSPWRLCPRCVVQSISTSGIPIYDLDEDNISSCISKGLGIAYCSFHTKERTANKFCAGIETGFSEEEIRIHVAGIRSARSKKRFPINTKKVAKAAKREASGNGSKSPTKTKKSQRPIKEVTAKDEESLARDSEEALAFLKKSFD